MLHQLSFATDDTGCKSASRLVSVCSQLPFGKLHEKQWQELSRASIACLQCSSPAGLPECERGSMNSDKPCRQWWWMDVAELCLHFSYTFANQGTLALNLQIDPSIIATQGRIMVYVFWGLLIVSLKLLDDIAWRQVRVKFLRVWPAFLPFVAKQISIEIAIVSLDSLLSLPFQGCIDESMS